MEPISILKIAKITKGVLKWDRGDILIEDISIDSNNIKRNSLFIAIKGKNFDGHDFIEEAFNKGAKAVIICKEIKLPFKDKAIIKVKDSIKALGEIAYYNRSRYKNTLIAITGSNGKSTTKEMVASVLSKKYKVCKSEKSYNNEIGVPLTLLKVNPEDEYIVAEMGMNKRGEIDNLANLSKPNIGVITNIGKTHLEELKSVQNVFLGKIELLPHLCKEKILILNADDPYTPKIKKIFKGKIKTIGINNKADYRAISIKREGISSISFKVENKAEDIRIKKIGIYNVYNSLVAFAIGDLLNVDLSLIKEGLWEVENLPGRSQIIKKEDLVIIDDTYNANPTSMKKAIDLLMEIPKVRRRILVLGSMWELGRYRKKHHRDLGSYIAENKIDLLYTYGDLGREIGIGAEKNNFPSENILHFKDREELILSLRKSIRPFDCILIKGSRIMEMEKIVKELL
jgi:UDP-N-acetylmuramoyl-tripeptide--D-alanyl-D-alanine ligase